MTVWEQLAATLATSTYAGMDDATTAATYNAQTVPVSQPIISMAELLSWGAASGALDALIEGQASYTNASPGIQQAVRSACEAAIKQFDGSVPSFNLASTANQSGAGLLVTYGIWTTAQAASLVALGTVQAPLYSQPGQFGQPITAGDVAASRS